MPAKYGPADLIRIHRAEILDEFTKLGFLRPQYAPATLNPEFSQIIMAAQFPSGLDRQKRDILIRNLGRLIGKAVMLRDKRNRFRDRILQAAHLENF